MKAYLSKVLAVTGLVALTACSEAAPTTEPTGADIPSEYFSDTSGVWFSGFDGKLRISEFEEWGESAKRLDDGSIELFGTAKVELAGKGAHEVDAIANFESVEAGMRRTLATVDVDATAERVFHHDQDLGAIVIGDFEGGAFVFNNPDGSYDVVTAQFDGPENEDEYLHAENGLEAWKIVSEFNEYKSTSPHSLALAAVLASSRVVDARAVQHCDLPDCTETSIAADGPSVCDLFGEVCLCSLCLAIDMADDMCAPCAP